MAEAVMFLSCILEVFCSKLRQKIAYRGLYQSLQANARVVRELRPTPRFPTCSSSHNSTRQSSSYWQRREMKSLQTDIKTKCWRSYSNWNRRLGRKLHNNQWVNGTIPHLLTQFGHVACVDKYLYIYILVSRSEGRKKIWDEYPLSLIQSLFSHFFCHFKCTCVILSARET